MVKIYDTCDICEGKGYIIKKADDGDRQEDCPRNHHLGAPIAIETFVTLSEFRLLLADEKLKKTH